MKKLLFLPLLVLLTGCVTYYYPETALEDGVYYAEDDPSYVVYSDAYAGVAFYPWSSLDYFYLGYNPYPGYSFGYGYGSGFSFGISYGYSPWYYPHHNHGYYSPWYASHNYSYYPAWGPYNGYDSHHGGGHRTGKNNHRGKGYDRYAGNGHNDRQDKYVGNRDRKNNGANRRDRELVDDYNPSSVRRYVSAAPVGHSGNRGMVIRSRETTKITKSKLHPDRSAPAPSISANIPGSRSVQSGYSTKRSANEVRYRSNTKPTRSRTEPVKSASSSRDVVIASASPATVRTSSYSNNGRNSTRTITRQVAPKRPPSSSNSRPPAKSQAKASSTSMPRSHSSSSNSNRHSKNKASSRQRNRR